MRYNEILNEKNDINEMITFFKRVKKDCSDIITIYRNTNLLYRGINNVPNNMVKLSSLKNREPKNTPQIFQNLIDTWLKEHNFTALRSNSYFATSRIKTASIYGNPYIIFPVNGYSYTWFENSDDLYHTIHIRFKDIEEILNGDPTYEKLKTEIGRIRYNTANLEKFYNAFPELFNEQLNKMMSDINPKDTDLEQAIDSTYEIMFTGDYYILDADMISDLLVHKKNNYLSTENVIHKILSFDNDKNMAEFINTFLG